jgi:molecular chaperone DnaK
MGKLIGIDLGTTNSVAAAISGSPHPQVLNSREAQPQTRSVVGVQKKKGKQKGDGEELLVGDVALDNWALAPDDTIISVKRLMGRGVADPEVQRVREWALYHIVEPADGTKDGVRVVMGGKQYSPVDVSAMILSKIKEDSEFRLGVSVTHAVITVPAYFSQSQRDATRKAGLRAGLQVIKILDEPTAAAIAFGLESGDGTPKTLLVYDLGGGTFDISLLMWAGNVFAPLELQGDMWLGGDDFDQVIVNHALRYVREEFDIDPTAERTRENRRFMVELKKAAQKAKERLSSSRSTKIIVAGLLRDADGDFLDLNMEIMRDEYERMIEPLVERTVVLTKKAMKNAKLTPDQVDYVLMAGNSTGIPVVQEAMEKLFGADKVMRNIHPKHCVALGAAIVAQRIGERVVCQAQVGPAGRECGHVNSPEAATCANCGTALRLQEGQGKDGEITLIFGGITSVNYGAQSAGDRFNVFIKKGDTYPTEEPYPTITFYTRAPNARMASIPIYGGENLEKASANEKQFEAFAILPPGLPQGTPVRVKLWLDENQIFYLSASLEDGTDLRPWKVEGGADAKATEVIEQVERKLGEKQSALSAQEMGEIEEARNRAFDLMREGKYEQALRQAEELAHLANSAGSDAEGDPLHANANNLVLYVEYILDEYGWALEPQQSYRLNLLVDEVKSALGLRDARAIEEKARELEGATDTLPEGLRILLGARGVIATRIQSVDPVLGRSLLLELDDVENAFRARNPAASNRLDAFLDKLTGVMTQVEKLQPGSKRCSQGHAVPSGERICPECKEDTWMLEAKLFGA